jgi:hypothetical protein
MTHCESKVTQEIMEEPFQHDKPLDSDQEVVRTLKDAAHANIETCKLESLGREADRLLDLIVDVELVPKAPSQSTPTAAVKAEGPVGDAKSLLQPTELPAKAVLSKPKVWLLILPLLGLGGAVGFAIRSGMGSASKHSVQDRSPTQRLAYQVSCGSKTNLNKPLMWPVLTEYDLVLLQVVRRSYCGDAYMNSNGALQVASFISEQKAQNFAHLLSVATGKPFRVGQRNSPAAANSPSIHHNSNTPLPTPVRQKQISQVTEKQASPIATEAALAVESVNALYNALSTKNFDESPRWHTAAVSDQFTPDFFSQFSRVSATDLMVSNTNGQLITLSGIIRFDYPDNRYQIESRTFTVDLTANPPQVVASKFVRVLKPR